MDSTTTFFFYLIRRLTAFLANLERVNEVTLQFQLDYRVMSPSLAALNAWDPTISGLLDVIMKKGCTALNVEGRDVCRAFIPVPAHPEPTACHSDETTCTVNDVYPPPPDCERVWAESSGGIFAFWKSAAGPQNIQYPLQHTSARSLLQVDNGDS
ncbi:hypothetical protein MSAN_00670200 [Mycena sanguinolenta]|uniref:Uncharacterized protein n=1 Tax=Mycena sanguinolenta TaxID=230812 RepID=A0A8H6Z460_9AGAR|nr:hypothetical protein MSAN_00670200 [Mycena sanguinolenta]